MKPRYHSGLPSPLYTACPQPRPQHHQHHQQLEASSRSEGPNDPQPAGAVHNGCHPSTNLVSSSSSSSSSDTDSSDNNDAKSANRSHRRRSVGVRARVLFNFEASGPGEISVTIDQSVRALYHVDRRWLFVLTGSGAVGYIPFLYATKEAWAPSRPVPSMRRYCRGFSPQSAESPTMSSELQQEQQQQQVQLCLPADLSRPPAMTDDEEEKLIGCSTLTAELSGQRPVRPSSLRLDQARGLADWKAESGCTTRLLRVEPPPPPAPLPADRPRRSSFDSAVTAAVAAKRRVTFRPDAEIIGTADNIDRQPVYQQSAAPVQQDRRHSYFGQWRQSDASDSELDTAVGEINCVFLQTLV